MEKENSEELKKILKKPINFYPALARAIGGIEAAIFAQQLYNWSKETENPEGWIDKTTEEWQEATTLTPEQQDGVIEHLKRFKILQTVRYRLDPDFVDLYSFLFRKEKNTDIDQKVK